MCDWSRYAARPNYLLKFKRLAASLINLPVVRYGDGLFERSPAHNVQTLGRLDDYPELVRLSDGVIDVGSASPIDLGHRRGCRCILLA